jgi:hypothetical protein
VLPSECWLLTYKCVECPGPSDFVIPCTQIPNLPDVPFVFKVGQGCWYVNDLSDTVDTIPPGYTEIIPTDFYPDCPTCCASVPDPCTNCGPCADTFFVSVDDLQYDPDYDWLVGPSVRTCGDPLNDCYICDSFAAPVMQSGDNCYWSAATPFDACGAGPCGTVVVQSLVLRCNEILPAWVVELAFTGQMWDGHQGFCRSRNISCTAVLDITPPPQCPPTGTYPVTDWGGELLLGAGTVTIS